MTKPAIYKVKLASGVTRHIVAWEFDHVAAMRFESAPDASLPPSFDAIRGIEWVMDCDAVLFRDEDLPKHDIVPRSGRCVNCDGWLHWANGALIPCGYCERWRPAALEPKPEATQGWLPGTVPAETLPSEAKSSWSVGDFCPMACGTKLRSSLGQLICGMGHQIGEAKDMGSEWQPGFRSTMRKLQELADVENAKPERQRVPHGLGCQCPDCTKEAARAL